MDSVLSQPWFGWAIAVVIALPVLTVALTELGVDPEDFTHPRAIMVDIERRPERERGEIIDGNSTAATRLVDFLESKNLI